MEGIEVRVVDEERRPLPAGQVGELAYRGESRMLGYYRAPELSEATIDGEGWLYTGDLAVMDDEGFIRIVGRKKDLIIRGGQNVYPAEIEHCIAALAGVVEAAVVGVPGPTGDERVWAFVELQDGAEITAHDVLRHCRQGLEAYKIPDQVHIVRGLPRTALGKVAKRELRLRALHEMGVMGHTAREEEHDTAIGRIES
jgi:acyl-CoA synthetase (AMP-forming)/AMP-acid ligase II